MFCSLVSDMQVENTSPIVFHCSIIQKNGILLQNIAPTYSSHGATQYHTIGWHITILKSFNAHSTNLFDITTI